MKQTIRTGMLFFAALIIISATACKQQENNTMKILAGTGEPGFEDGVHGMMNKPIRLTPYKDSSVIFADINNHAIRCVNLKGELLTIAGGPGKEGFADGDVSEAKFKSPHGVAYDAATGIIYVASASNHVIRMITPDGNGSYTVSTLAGVAGESGYADGAADSAKFNSPHCVLMAPGGGVYTVDIGNARVRKVQDGIVSTVAGNGEHGALDGKPAEASFTYPIDMVMDGDDIIVIDAATNSIRRIIPGSEVKTISLQDTLATPHGIAVDKNGILYEADMDTGRILSIDKDGKVSVLAGTGENGTAAEQLNKPAAVLVHAGHLWIADLDNHQIKIIKLDD